MKIVKFETIGCPNCRKLSAILQVANLVPDRDVIISDENLDVAKKFNVQSFYCALVCAFKGQGLRNKEG